jgi:hypothetical protein
VRTRSRRPGALLGALAILLLRLPLSAHSLPVETTAYFKIEPAGLRVLVRLPMVTLSDAKLPLTARGTMDLEAARSALAAAAAEFVRSSDVVDGGQPLPPPRITWVVSAANDSSFASYDTAAVHLTQTALPDLAVNEGFLDLQLDYRLRSSAPRLSIRFNGQRANGAFVPTRAIYLTARGDERRFAIVGPPHRVSFEPSLFDAAAMSLKLGLQRLLGEQKLLLFLVCLVIPLRPSSTTLRLVGATLAASVAASGVVAVLPSPPGLQVQLLWQLIASIALGGAALQNMQMPRLGWVRGLAVLFGTAHGIGTGVAARELRPFAGSWDLAGLAVFIGVLAIGAVLLTPFLRIAIGAVASAARRLPVPTAAVPLLLSLVPLHTALHAIQADGEELRGASAGHGGLTVLVANWPPVVLALTLAVLALATRRSGLAGRAGAAAGDGARER